MKQEFLERIKTYIPNEYDAFLASFDQPLLKGLSLNTKKLLKEEFEEKSGLVWKQSPFSTYGSIVDQSLGLHPLHVAGGFYLQEPSASAPVSALDIQGDEVILDLCAAPGGKSMQIATQLTSGFLLSNEYNSHRAQILLSNMERMGFDHVAIANTTTQAIAQNYPACFDKVLVDAPCSGEGMMHKHQEAMDQWSIDLVLQCQQRQMEIVGHAIECLKKGGLLVYSTCTYAKEENEDVVEWVLDNYPEMQLVAIKNDFGREGFIPGTKRIFPMDQGEGQFMACFRKVEGQTNSLKECNKDPVSKVVKEFIDSQLKKQKFFYRVMQDKVWMKRNPFYDLDKIKILRQGIYAGQEKKNRFEPAHSFYMAAQYPFINQVELTLDQMNAFMHGLEIEKECKKGYVAVTYQGMNFGFGKANGKTIKNKIPKGLRLLEKSNVQQ